MEDAPAGQPEPYADAHAADLLDGEGPVYVLGGVLAPGADEAGNPATCLYVGQGFGRPLDEELLPLFEFFQTPRTETQAREWLEWAGAPEILAELNKSTLVITVDSRQPWKAAKSMRGLKLVAQSAPGEPMLGEIGVMVEGSSKPVMYVGPELASVLWGNDLGEDIPTVVEKIAHAAGADKDRTARQVLSEVPMLLEYGYARLEWLRVPGIRAPKPPGRPVCFKPAAAEPGPRQPRT